MMIVTLQTWGSLAPKLSVHGVMIKIDLGVLLLEMNTEEYKNIIANLTVQAKEKGVYD